MADASESWLRGASGVRRRLGNGADTYPGSHDLGLNFRAFHSRDASHNSSGFPYHTLLHLLPLPRRKATTPDNKVIAGCIIFTSMLCHSSASILAALLALTAVSSAESLGSSAGSSGGLFSDTLLRKDQLKTVLEHTPVSQTECRQSVRYIQLPAHDVMLTQIYIRLQTTGPIETTACDYESIDSVTEDLFDNLHELVQTPFFKYFRVCFQ